MVEKSVVMPLATGLIVEPAGVLCKEAGCFKSRIQFSVGNTTANAKSVLSVLGACVRVGDEMVFTCEGEDEEAALEHMIALISSGLGQM